MGEPTYDVIVIGSGPGGAACATLLQKRGYNTLLLEKNSFVGGKMMSIKKDGYAYDFYPHGQVPMRNPAFKAIFDELGVGDEFKPALDPEDDRDVVCIAYRAREWKDYRIMSQGQAMADATPFFKLWELDDPAEQQKAIAFMTEMATMPEDKLDELDNVSMHDFLQQYDIPYRLYSYLAFHANAR
ncbi:MAG: FAD-dependent oxidoreductase [Deltaproteobacteria bacterium]|nr:MAG: FAD-dependent oxidoreductase [Deltaproteobacteria bacterium]